MGSVLALRQSELIRVSPGRGLSHWSSDVRGTGKCAAVIFVLTISRRISAGKQYAGKAMHHDAVLIAAYIDTFVCCLRRPGGTGNDRRLLLLLES